MTVYDDLASKLRNVAVHHVHQESPPVMRFKVKRANPLVIEHVGAEDLTLEEGDPDFEIAQPLLDHRPSVGDMVVVHADRFHDYIAVTVVHHGN